MLVNAQIDNTMPANKCFALFLGIMLIFSAVSCGEDPLENSYETQESGPYLMADVSSVTVPAQELKTAPTDKAIMISSNRAWTASLEPAADWLRVSCLASGNDDHSVKKTLVLFSFNMYEDEETDRQTVLKLKGEDGLSLDIPVIQRKAIPVPLLLLPSEDCVAVLAEMPGGNAVVKNLTITTNISWTAAFEPAVDWVSVTPATYVQDDREEAEVDMVLTFQPNASTTDDRSTKLVLTADGGKGRLEIPITQNKKEAIVQWVSSATDYVSTAEGSMTLEFVATDAWTATLNDAAEGISLSATSGDPTVTSLNVNFTRFEGPGAVRSATVVLSLTNGVNASLAVRQIGTELSLNLIGGNQPFSTDITYGTAVVGETKNYTLVCNGKSYDFAFGAVSADGYKFVAATEDKTCGLLTNKNDWIRLPAVEGMKLKEVEIYTSNMGSSASKGYGRRETPDGAELAAKWVYAHGEWCDLVLDNPAAGKIYYIASLNNSAYFSKLNLIYE